MGDGGGRGGGDGGAQSGPERESGGGKVSPQSAAGGSVRL